MTDYVRSSNPIWYFVDLQGVQFDDNCYMWVLQNQIPYLPISVYHAPTGVAWSNPIRFEANGTLPIEIFWDSNQVYRLEFRRNDGTQAPSQADELIYLVENYLANGQTSEQIDVNGISTENQLSNPQFAEMSLTLPYTLSGVSNPAPIEIAPDWFLELTGNGNVTIDRLSINDSVQTPTNAPYALRINLSGGWTSLPVLRQRLNQNGVLWSDKYVSSSLTARIEGIPQNLTARLDASDGSKLVILQVAALENDFTEFTGTALVPESTNADFPPNAYIDFKVLLPSVGDVYITSLQLVTLSVDSTVAYQQDSVDRQIDHLFHYYKDKLIEKPIQSYLTAWNFAFNPVQFFGETRTAQVIGANKSEYKWDQTIVFQSVDSGVGVTRNAATGGLVVTQASATAGQFAIIQYLPGKNAREILRSSCAVGLSALTNKVGGAFGTISLWVTDNATLPNVAAGTNNSIVLTLDANGKPATKNGNWTEITRANNDSGLFDLSTTQTNVMLSNFDISNNALVNTATFFAIVIGFESLAQAESVTIDWVSLCKGSFATVPAPQTQDEVLDNCEYYFETSYSASSFPASITSSGAILKIMGSSLLSAGAAGWKGWPFDIEFKTIKRSVSPTVNVYSPSAGTISIVDQTVTTINQDKTSSATVNISGWTESLKGDKAVSFIPNSNIVGPAFGSSADTPLNIPYAYIAFHYAIDARLGIVN